MKECSYCHGNGCMWDSSDYEPLAARIIADVDAESYRESWMRVGRGQDLGHLLDPLDYERNLYQCPECGRLLIERAENPGTFSIFVPEDEHFPIVTGPAEGDRWRHFLSGNLNSRTVDELTGREREYRRFKTGEEAKNFFYARFEELRSADLLESAIFSENKKVVFRWNYDNTEPVPSAWKVYLSPEEQEAFARFKSDHRMCCWYYPSPQRGPMSYEVVPSSAGLFSRFLRVTCCYCGAYVQSDDGAVSYGKPYKEMLPESERHYAIPVEEFRGNCGDNSRPISR